MRKLTSGVYFVDYKNIQTFLDHSKKSGWDWGDGVDVYDEFAGYTTPKSIIPFSLNSDDNRIRYWREQFSLDSDDNRIGYWREQICDNQADLLNQIENWNDWDYTERYIEHYKPKTVIL